MVGLPLGQLAILAQLDEAGAIEVEMSALYNTQLYATIKQGVAALQAIAASQAKIASALTELAWPTPTGFSIALAKAPESKPMDFVINDDGKGIVFTAVAQKNGQPVTLRPGQVPAWQILDSTGAPAPGVLNLSTDSTGLIATGTLPTPPVDGTGYVAQISLTLTDGTVITDNSPAFDIVPDPDNVDSFVITEAAAQ